MAQLCTLTAASTAFSRWSSGGGSSSMVGGLRITSPLFAPFSLSCTTTASPTAAPLRVNCSSGQPPPPLKESNDGSSKKEPSWPANAEQQTTSKQRPADLSLASLFAVNGAAPETINGRMAMLGFVWALVAEKLTGLGVVDQLFDRSASGLLWFGAVVFLFTLASLIPFTNGESIDTRRWGPFTGKAELWNGRLAMLGFAALVFSEIVRQGPLLPG